MYNTISLTTQQTNPQPLPKQGLQNAKPTIF